MRDTNLVFIMYPEVYALLNEHVGDDRWLPHERNRLAALIAAWDAAIQDHGDNVAKVHIYSKDGELSFDAFEKAWDGTVTFPDEDEEV